MLVLPDKQAASLGRADALWSTRASWAASGLLIHYLAAVMHLCVLVTELQRRLMMRGTMRSDLGGPCGPVGGAVRSPRAFPGEEPALYSHLTWDASTFGWATLACCWDLTGSAPAGGMIASSLSVRLREECWRSKRSSQRPTSGVANASSATTLLWQSLRFARATRSRPRCSAVPSACRAWRPALRHRRLSALSRAGPRPHCRGH
jgi:hypothetical protein